MITGSGTRARVWPGCSSESRCCCAATTRRGCLRGEHNLVKAGRAILKMGPSTVLIKRGEYGVLQFSDEGMFAVPAYPLEEVVDPTGRGRYVCRRDDGIYRAARTRDGVVAADGGRVRQRARVVRGRAFLAGKAFGFDLGRNRQSLSRVYQLNRLTSFEMDYSVVIPLYNERDSLGPLHEELSRVMQSLGRSLRTYIRGRRQH